MPFKLKETIANIKSAKKRKEKKEAERVKKEEEEKKKQRKRERDRQRYWEKKKRKKEKNDTSIGALGNVEGDKDSKKKIRNGSEVGDENVAPTNEKNVKKKPYEDLKQYAIDSDDDAYF